MEPIVVEQSYPAPVSALWRARTDKELGEPALRSGRVSLERLGSPVEAPNR